MWEEELSSGIAYLEQSSSETTVRWLGWPWGPHTAGSTWISSSSPFPMLSHTSGVHISSEQCRFKIKADSLLH
jgi:hypothetical protein